jgi:hypothetical protein
MEAIKRKTWNIPVAVAEGFVANEYVSACTATIDCNLVTPEPYIALDIEFGKSIPTVIGDRTWVSHNACGKVHEVGTHGELSEITIHDGTAMVNGVKTQNYPLEEPIVCYFWAEYDENGVLIDGHCTMTKDGFQANMS